MLEAAKATKSFGSHKVLKDVTLSVTKGSCFALLGPNGAGKTTFVKAMLDITRLDSGAIKIKGKDSKDKLCRKGARFLPEKFSFFPYDRVGSVVAFYGKMHGLRGEDLKREVVSALDQIAITPLEDKKIKTLSKGQIQRVGIATLLMGKGDLFILDEPFSGLDPIGIKDLKTLLGRLKEKEKTVFINSHILSEMEQICDAIAILDKGDCLVSGKLKDILGARRGKGETLEDFFYKKIRINQ